MGVGVLVGGIGVGVSVGAGVGVSVGIAVWVGVRVAVGGNRVYVGVAVMEGVVVGLGVLVDAGVFVGAAVAEGVILRVGVGVGVMIKAKADSVKLLGSTSKAMSNPNVRQKLLIPSKATMNRQLLRRMGSGLLAARRIRFAEEFDREVLQGGGDFVTEIGDDFKRVSNAGRFQRLTENARPFEASRALIGIPRARHVAGNVVFFADDNQKLHALELGAIHGVV